MYRISIIGAGNVATHFAIAFTMAGHNVECICNRDIEKAEKLCKILCRYKGKAAFVSDYKAIPDSDIVFICVADSAIKEVVKSLSIRKKDELGSVGKNNIDNLEDVGRTSGNTLYVHTSGATSIDVFKANPQIKNYGVFYPLMTLSRNKSVDMKMVPFLLEAGSKENEEKLSKLVSSLKAEYNICTSQKRLQMHTAAVFATNFVNYMFTLAYDIAKPDFTFLLPTAIEAVRKAFLNTPMTSQTGPALRGDTGTMNRHIELLERGGFTEHAEVYKQLSECIMKKFSAIDKK